MDLGIHVDQHTLRSEPLGAMRGNGIAVIKVTHLLRIDGDVLCHYPYEGDSPV